MLVEEIMIQRVYTVAPTDTVRMGLVLIQQYEIRHIPVVEDGHLVGIVSDRDLRDVCPSTLGCEEKSEIWNTPIAKIMKREVITAHPLDFIDEAAYTMYSARISCLPIVSNGELVGIITATDLLSTLVELMGVHNPTTRVEIESPNPVEDLQMVTKILAQYTCHIDSLMVMPDTPTKKQRIILRITTMNPGDILLAFKHSGLRILWPHDLGVDL